MLTTLLNCSTSFLMHPDRNEYDSPRKLGIQTEEWMLPSSNGVTVHAVLLHAIQSKRHSVNTKKPLVIQLHGNAQNISSHFYGVIWLLKAGYPVLIFDYRGFGKTTGSASINGSVDDSVIAFKHAQKIAEREGRQIILYGQSIGSSMAQCLLQKIEARDQKNIRLLILDGGFRSYHEVASDIVPMWLYPIAWMILLDAPHPEHFNNPEKIPTLIIHGDKDDIIFVRHAEILHKNLKDSKLLIIQGASHLNWMKSEENEKRVVELLEEMLANSKAR